MKAPWILLFEAWAVARLTRSPLFNRTIQKIHRRMNRLPPTEAENGGGRTGPSAFDHFKTEIKDQFRELTWQNRPPKQ
ncbi:hypothetical protein K491DRAFT_688117 [Lophiostoma macrostomum CBS 122681]|uniref:Uncharacterized protein n=1 Tax=Lophiostoma macrostomum CBS 122681 TaxID=1314788 RepID=A0A6A6TLP3_9PLEO|nr:hypothetical protein K491DRAFT_688117 [Lophiostoma macrostomum CBS 122681]